ncbi:MAG: imidazole glycerol phosphate synthase subunit HisH [Candidatus Sumerlaeota bacterium]|nr:imidazole glycerol phosphate synthase subunit HisH [Candidatus Sumerlaeota bacterium]
MIEIVDYEAGNLTSVRRALDHLGIESRITPDADKIARAQRIIFPGVGRAGSSMETLKRRGLDEALKQAFAKGTPILGICIGMQVSFDYSEEDDTQCLGLLKGRVKRFRLNDPALKVPHMGWNGIRVQRPHPLLEHVRPQDEFYFVHSYYPAPADAADIVAVTEYETVFACAAGRRNLFVTQFHPEKSGPAGLQILERFTRWEGESC